LVATTIALFFGLFGGAMFSLVLEDSRGMAIASELKRYWYWYMLSSSVSYYLIEQIVGYIQQMIFEEATQGKASILHRIVGAILSFMLIAVSYYAGDPWNVMLVIFVLTLGIYLAVKGNGDQSIYQKELSELMLDKMENFASSTILERQVFLEQRIYSDPDFRQFAKKYNMTEDEFVSKVARYNSKNPGAYSKLLRYDVRKSKFKDFI
jgi:uncharacterized membrane protein